MLSSRSCASAVLKMERFVAAAEPNRNHLKCNRKQNSQIKTAQILNTYFGVFFVVAAENCFVSRMRTRYAAVHAFRTERVRIYVYISEQLKL